MDPAIKVICDYLKDFSGECLDEEELESDARFLVRQVLSASDSAPQARGFASHVVSLRSLIESYIQTYEDATRYHRQESRNERASTFELVAKQLKNLMACSVGDTTEAEAFLRENRLGVILHRESEDQLRALASEQRVRAETAEESLRVVTLERDKALRESQLWQEHMDKPCPGCDWCAPPLKGTN